MPLLPCISVFLTLLEIAWNTFGLSPTVVHCSEIITLDQLHDGILVEKAGEGRPDASAPDLDSQVYQVGSSPLFIYSISGLLVVVKYLTRLISCLRYPPMPLPWSSPIIPLDLRFRLSEIYVPAWGRSHCPTKFLI